MLEILTTDGVLDTSPEPMTALAHSVALVGTPDRVIGLEDSNEMQEGWDWVAGYSVIRTAPGEHRGFAATRITLGDENGQREVGRLVLRNDALHDGALEFVRQFETDEHRDAFLERLANAPGSDEIKTVELDTVFDDDDLLATLQLVTDNSTISYRIVQLVGPGGGWPIVAFTGKDRELREMMRRSYGFEDKDLEDMLG